MTVFRYTALDAMGKPVRGVVDAASEAALAQNIHRSGQRLVRVDPVGRYGWVLDLLYADVAPERGLSKTAIGQFTRELAVMLAAGQDIDHALRFIVESTDEKRARRVFDKLRQQVRGGKSLAAGLAEHPRVFSRLYISVVRAGEAGGSLPESLSRLADLLERERKLTASIQSALVYPALLVVAAIATVIMLITYVLPQFTPIFVQAGAHLPTATQILISIGDFLRDNGLWLLLALVVFVIVVRTALRRPKPRRAFDRLVLFLPIAGALIRQAQAARLTRTLGTLQSNGVSLVAAMGIARGVLGNAVAEEVVETAAAKVKEGARLAGSLAAGKFFPAQTIHLLQLGEETGKLGAMALRAADIHDDQVQQTLQRLVSLLVPLITIFVGLVVAGIVGSLLAAMLSLNDLAV